MSRRLVRDLLVPLPFSSILPLGPARNPAFRGGRSAGRRRDDPDAVRGQPGAMADASNVRHDTIVVPERMSPAQVRRWRSGRRKLKSATMTWWPFCISTDHGRSAASMAPRWSGVTATR